MKYQPISKEQADVDANPLLPEGWYTMQILERGTIGKDNVAVQSEERVSGNGNPFWTLVLRVPGTTKIVFGQAMFTTGFAFQGRHLADATGNTAPYENGTFALSMVVNKPVDVRVKHELITEGKNAGKYRERVVDYAEPGSKIGTPVQKSVPPQQSQDGPPAGHPAALGPAMDDDIPF
jgi:hypothetical protein